MFYEGDLRSGITLAIQESKLVACFVRDDGPESATWEDDFLADPELQALLASQTVLLKMQAGGEEAGFLAALFPLPKTPTFVVIQNGQLKEYLTAGTTKDVFFRRLRVVLGGDASLTPPIDVGAASTSPVASATPSSTPATSISSAQNVQPAAPSGTSPENNPAVSEPQSRQVQDVLNERRIRLEAQKKKQDAAEKAERAAKAAERKAALEASTPEGAQKSADMKYALQQKKRQQDALEERARILKRVENDKVARREKEALRKEQAKAASENEVSAPADPAELFSSKIQRPSSAKMTECAIQVRLFDGSTIRSRFPSTGSLRKDVRKWVDTQRPAGEDFPYTFKQILTPLPNRNLSIGEEEETLQELGLAPSATLILMPVKDYTSAYEYSGVTGLVTRGASAGLGLVSSGVGVITGVLGGLLGSGSAPGTPPSAEQGASTPPVAASSINIRTLRDQRRPQDNQQFYNGNTLNFEPRRDNDEKED